MNEHELKSLQTRLTLAQGKEVVAQLEHHNSTRALGEARKVIRELEASIKRLQETAVEPIISEHAILRYIERCCEWDIDEIKSNILDEKTRELIKTYKSGKFPVGDTHRVVVKKGVVVTIEV